MSNEERKAKFLAIGKRHMMTASTKHTPGWGSPRGYCAQLFDIMASELNRGDFTAALTTLLQLVDKSYS